MPYSPLADGPSPLFGHPAPMARRPKLPLRITLLLGLVLIITVLSLVRLYTAVAWSGILMTYLSPGEVYYIGATGAFWFLAGILLLWAFWRRARRTRELFLGAALLYSAWSWADRLVVQAWQRPNWHFSLLATVVLLGYTASVMLDPRNQIHLGRETYE